MLTKKTTFAFFVLVFAVPLFGQKPAQQKAKKPAKPLFKGEMQKEFETLSKQDQKIVLGVRPAYIGLNGAIAMFQQKPHPNVVREMQDRIKSGESIATTAWALKMGEVGMLPYNLNEIISADSNEKTISGWATREMNISARDRKVPIPKSVIRYRLKTIETPTQAVDMSLDRKYQFERIWKFTKTDGGYNVLEEVDTTDARAFVKKWFKKLPRRLK